MIHIRGQQQRKATDDEDDEKDELCKMKDNRYHKAGRNVPWQQCVCCPYSLSCEYIGQFDKLGINIRIMTHHEWSNIEPTWSPGHHSLDNGDIQPRSVDAGSQITSSLMKIYSA